MKKDRFEILLEDMKSDIKLVLEGHSVLDNKIEQVKTSISNLDLKMEDTNNILKEHIKQPAHA